MEVLGFDIQGKFAHFRKFHGNNTALSYSIPPRTTIIGMLATIMGEKKDSYYEKYRSENLRIGIRVLADLKKGFHRLNLLKIVGREDFSGRHGRIQTPFEVLTGLDLRKDSVAYRIYLAPGEDGELYQILKNRLLTGERQFNLSLGIAGFAAGITGVTLFETTPIQANHDWVDIDSACNSEQVSEIEFPDHPEIKFNHIEEELLPADFIGGNKGREVHRMNRVLFTTRPFPMHVKLAGSYFPITREDGATENIQFLDYAGILPQQK